MPDTVDQPTANPTRKVGAGAIAGALTVILAWMVGEFTDVNLTAEVSSAVTVVLTFATSYIVRERA